MHSPDDDMPRHRGHDMACNTTVVCLNTGPSQSQDFQRYLSGTRGMGNTTEMNQPLNDRWHELWGTFSVHDHCRRGAFVAEVLMYDKLLIPVPPAVPDGLDPTEAKREWQRWTDSNWDPERQQAIVNILGDRAQPIPWTAEMQGQWKSAMQDGFAAARHFGYFMTGSVLQQFAPAMARTVVAVSQYHSLAELEKAGIRQCRPAEKVPASTLLAVLGHELLLPDDPKKDDLEVLREAVEVSADPNYRLRRRALLQWQQEFLTADSMTDAPSVKTAVVHMQGLVDALKTATARQRKWKWAKRFFSFLGVASKAGTLGGPVLALPAAGASVVAAIGAFAVDEAAAARKAPDAAIPAATLILEAREKLGFE
jgi:hypothetical protein